MRHAGPAEVEGYRMTRFRLTLATVLSLLLCVATAVLWVRSYFVGDLLLWTRHSGVGPSLLSWDGRVAYRSEWALFDEGSHDGVTWARIPADFYPLVLDLPVLFPESYRYHGLGFEIAEGAVQASPYHFRTLDCAIPDYFLVAILLVLPLCRAKELLRSIGRRSRLLRNLCLSCGYSLTGNTSGVCPECGTPVNLRSETTA
jgi:hypothetical protein